MTPWWNAQGVGAKLAVLVAGLVVALTVVSYGLRTVVGKEPGGPTSSSFATGSDGLAAFAELAARQGHQVVQLQAPLDRVALEANVTVVVAQPDRLAEQEIDALEQAAKNGARVLISGDPEPFGHLTEGLRWSSRGSGSAEVLLPLPALAKVERVVASKEGSWSDLGPWLGLIGGNEGVIVAQRQTGAGSVVALADPSLWWNEQLGEADNAALAVALLGEPARTVIFAEAAHGYTGGKGFGAYPRSWRWVAAGLVSAGICYAFAVGRRFGPPERTERELAPPRRAYADALARSLAQVGDPSATTALRHRARQQWRRRTGIDLDDAEGPAAATAAGLSTEDLDLLLQDPTTTEALLALGHLAASFEGTNLR